VSEGPPPAASPASAASFSRAAGGLLLIISGPSGVGKTTIARHVEKQLQGVFSVSLTTRPPTPKDVPGRDYVFVDRAEFDRRRENGELLEWAELFEHCYGTPRHPVVDALSRGELMICEIDVQGAVQIKERVPDAFAIFIMPPSEEALLQRLRDRGREDEPTIQRRFARAKHEIDRARSCGIYDAFLVNDDLPRALEQAVHIVQQQRQAR